MYVHFSVLLKTSVCYLLRARLHVRKNQPKKTLLKQKEQDLARKECRMVYMWPSEFIKYLIFVFFLTLTENYQKVGGKQMETRNER